MRAVDAPRDRLLGMADAGRGFSNLMDSATYNRKVSFIRDVVKAGDELCADFEQLRESIRELKTKRLTVLAQLDQAAAACDEIRTA